MTFFLLASAFLLLWILLVPAYPLWLRSWKPIERGDENRVREVWPEVDVIVAVRNEIGYIVEKIQNLRELRYPADKMRFWIVDGASTDQTVSLATETIGQDRRFHLLKLGKGNKITQVNAALKHCRGDWVLITDADARLGPDTLEKMIQVGLSDPKIAAMGSPVRPGVSHPLDRHHWVIADRLRMEEGWRGFSSIVTGPCYLFRRDLLESYPEDVFADDVHVAFSSFVKGRRVRYVPCDVQELRCATELWVFLRHKHRKAHNYLIEVFRFLPKMRQMPAMARRIFVRRAAQMTAGPLLLAGAFVSLLWGLLSTPIPAPSLTFGVIVGCLLLSAVWLGRRHFLDMAFGSTMMLVLFVAVLTYPVARRRKSTPHWRVPENGLNHSSMTMEAEKKVASGSGRAD